MRLTPAVVIPGDGTKNGTPSNGDPESGVVILEDSPKRPGRSNFVNHRVLRLFGIVAITYFVGCGGPMGSEPIVSAGGPLIGFIGIIVYLTFITMPFAWITAELCTAFPDDGGFAVWVLNACGPFWGFQVGYWSWISGIFNGAICPGLFLHTLLDLLETTVDKSVGQVGAFCIKAALAVLFTVPSVLGSKWVERTSIVLLVLVLLPYVVLTVWGYVEADDLEDLWEVRQKNMTYYEQAHDTLLSGGISIKWKLLINVLFWKFDGVYMASVFGGEVSNPAGVYPRAIALVIALTTLSYLVPLPAAVVTQTPHWQFYTQYSFPFIAQTIGGRLLEGFVSFSTLCATFGMFMAQIYCKTFQMVGMAEQRMLPVGFARRNQKFDSPHTSIFTTLFFTIALVGVDFQVLLPMSNAFSAAVHIMIIISVIRLRHTIPYAPRPTKVPCGTRTLMLIAVPPVVMAIFMTVSAFTTGIAAAIMIVFSVSGVVYGLIERRRKEGSPVSEFDYAPHQSLHSTR